MDQLKNIPFYFPGLKKIKCLFSTRLGGFSKDYYSGANLSFEVGDHPDCVLQNRKLVQNNEEFTFWQELRQVHGTRIINQPQTAFYSEHPENKGDGLSTNRADQALVIKVADCQPLLLAHNSGKYIAALHIGWRANQAGFIQHGLQVFCRHYQLQPRDILAVRGPSLGPGHSQFVNFQTEWGEKFRSYFNPETQTVNLWQLTKDQLLRAGLLPEHIFSIDLCTFSTPELFYSYRRDTVCGRQAGLIWIRA